jgi:hypothetical protein
VTDTCPICNTDYRDAAERIARRKVAEHIREKADRDEAHADWLAEHTAEGTAAEIRAALE